MSEMSLDEYRTRKPSKYKNKKQAYDGHTFDSIAELRRYKELLILVRAGTISGLTLQPSYELQPAFKAGGKTVRAIHYIADFQYSERGRTVVEDVKGVRTKEFNLKEKLFRFRYPGIDLRIVKM